MHRRKQELITVSQSFGLLDPREGTDAQEAFLHMMDVVIAPFRHVGDFNFATETYSQNSKDATLAFARAALNFSINALSAATLSSYRRCISPSPAS